MNEIERRKVLASNSCTQCGQEKLHLNMQPIAFDVSIGRVLFMIDSTCTNCHFGPVPFEKAVKENIINPFGFQKGELS